MSYIDDKIAKEDFFDRIFKKSKSDNSKHYAEIALRNLELFCQHTYKKDMDPVIDDLISIENSRKTFSFFQKFIDCPAGCHGVNWGAKADGGYYAYVTSQHANILTVVDPDPNGDGVGTDAEIVAQIVLANSASGVTDGTGGQGILPLPLVKDGWIQDTVEACDDGDCSSEVDGWINQLTSSQKDPST